VGGSALLADRQARGRIGRVVVHHRNADLEPGHRSEGTAAEDEFLHAPASKRHHHATSS
jgi:23S rRNA maturation-related 3'-5' exoribonuclease YhaM